MWVNFKLMTAVSVGQFKIVVDIVHGEEIGAHFITVWKDIEEDPDQETVSDKKTGGFDIPAWLRKQAD